MSKQHSQQPSSGVTVDYKGFQSANAMEAARVKVAVEDPSDEPMLAEVSLPEVVAKVATPEEIADSQKLVRVRSRTYVEPFFYGKKQYSLPAGKDVLIPRCVQQHLQDKGIL